MSGGLVELLGLRLEEVGPGTGSSSAGDCEPKHHQPFGIQHGGVYCAVVETAASIGAGLWFADRGTCVGVSNQTDFLRAVTRGRADRCRHADPPRPQPAALARRDHRRRAAARGPRSGAAAEPHEVGSRTSRGEQPRAPAAAQRWTASRAASSGVSCASDSAAVVFRRRRGCSRTLEIAAAVDRRDRELPAVDDDALAGVGPGCARGRPAADRRRWCSRPLDAAHTSTPRVGQAGAPAKVPGSSRGAVGLFAYAGARRRSASS